MSRQWTVATLECIEDVAVEASGHNPIAIWHISLHQILKDRVVVRLCGWTVVVVWVCGCCVVVDSILSNRRDPSINFKQFIPFRGDRRTNEVVDGLNGSCDLWVIKQSKPTIGRSKMNDHKPDAWIMSLFDQRRYEMNDSWWNAPEFLTTVWTLAVGSGWHSTWMRNQTAFSMEFPGAAQINRLKSTLVPANSQSFMPSTAICWLVFFRWRLLILSRRMHSYFSSFVIFSSSPSYIAVVVVVVIVVIVKNFVGFQISLLVFALCPTRPTEYEFFSSSNRKCSISRRGWSHPRM